MASQHYYSHKPRSPGRKYLVPLHIHGVSLEFLTYSSLFSGREVDEGTRLLLEYIRLPNEGMVLDLGCGYGVIGITIAKLNPKLKVYMVDINPLAVKASRYNARHNGVEDRVVVLQGDLYEPVKGMVFDAIYSNPPLSAGRAVVERIITEGVNHLKDGGFMQLVLAKGGEYYRSVGERYFRKVDVLRKKGYTILTMYK